MIRDKLLIRRLNRIIPNWQHEDGSTDASETMRLAARTQALKRLNLLYELVFEGNVNERSRLSHRATADTWALILYLESCCQEIGSDAKHEELVAV